MKYFRKHVSNYLVGIFLTALFAYLIQPQTPIVKNAFDRLSGMVYDIRLKASLPESPRVGQHNIFVVDIDEKSLKEVGRFPWDRIVVRDLISRLVEAGVVVIGFDIAFSEPQLNPVGQISKTELGKQMLTQSPEYFQTLYQELDADQQLASVLGDTDIVVGVLFQEDKQVQVGNLKPSTVIKLDPDAQNIQSLHFEGQLANLDVIQEAAAGQGFFNSSPDPDGYIRRAALIIEHEGDYYPSLALEAARLYTLSDNIELETEPLPYTEYHSMTAVRFGVTRIPTDEYGRVLVPFRGGQRSFPYYSATDILHQRIAPELLEGGIALIGTSAVGLADLRATSVGLQYPGVEVHANVLDGILQPELFSYRPDWWLAVMWIQVLLFGMVLTVLLPQLGPAYMAVTGGLSLCLVIGFNWYMWQQHIELPLMQPALLVVFLSVYNLAVGFFKENSTRQQIKSMFDQYVPPAHIDQMLDDPGSVSLEGERKELSVLFSDIRSFTTISERLSANDLKDMLNEYFSPITKSIFEHQGTIDKYVGDMVMAFWGAPLDDPNHAEHAVLGGFDMLAITAQLREQFTQKGWPEIHVGIGINTGEMNVGDMGSEFRRAYTVLGDAVNLGSRLEGLTKFYGVEFLVSETTKQQCPNVLFRPVDKVKVKGKDQAVAIFEPVAPIAQCNEQILLQVNQFAEAYQFYLEQQWAEARTRIQALQNDDPSRLLYSLYLERIDVLESNPPGDDWDGSYTHTSK